MRRAAIGAAAPAAIGVAIVVVATMWRRHPRTGTGFVNAVVNPALVRSGLAGTGGSEIGTLEHTGRRTGVRRLTPVHPEPTANGFRIVVPLGTQSEWARNVIAAGHCRLTLHDRTFDLDEPTMVDAARVDDLPWVLRRIMGALGFRYLSLRTFVADDGDVGDVAPSEAGTSAVDQGSAVDRDPSMIGR